MPTVVMVTQSSCPPCDRWWRDERPKWLSMGWDVVKVQTTGTPVRLTPTFRIFDAGRWVGFSGFMGVDAGTSVLRGETRAASFEKRGNPSSRSFSQLATTNSQLSSRNSQLSLPNGRHQARGEWSFPGGISDHLRGANHGLSTSQLVGRSQAELEALHSALHEGRGVAVRESTRWEGTLRTEPKATVRTASGCPTGGCPTSTSGTTRRGLFGWRRR